MRLGDACTKIGSGATPRGGSSAYVGIEGIPFIRSQNIHDFEFSAQGLAYISETQASVLDNVAVQSHDVLLNITGDSVARACIAKDSFLPARVNQHVAIIRGNPAKVDSQFLLYFLQWQKPMLLQLASSGATRKALTKQMLENLSLPSMDLSTQKKIAKILSNLDDKIALNKQINRNLEAQADATFKHLIAQKGQQVLFGDVVNICSGGTPKTSELKFWHGAIPFFTPKDAENSYVLTTEKSITHAGLDHCNSQLYAKDTVFLTARGSVGKLSLAGVPMAMNQSCYALQGRETAQLLVYFYAGSVLKSLRNKASGAVFDAITVRDIAEETVQILSDSDVQVFLRLVEPMYRIILINAISNKRLSSIRDALLPRLLSGEIDVSKSAL